MLRFRKYVFLGDGCLKEVPGGDSLVLLTGFSLYVFSGILCLTRIEKDVCFLFRD